MTTTENWAAAWRAYTGPVRCGLCGKEVEKDRRPPAYAHPTCHACLPPPEPLEVVEAPALEPLEELHMSAEEEFHSSVCEVLTGVERGADVDVETGGTAPGCPWCDQALPEDPQMEDHLDDCKLAALLWEARHQLKGMRE